MTIRQMYHLQFSKRPDEPKRIVVRTGSRKQKNLQVWELLYPRKIGGIDWGLVKVQRLKRGEDTDLPELIKS